LFSIPHNLELVILKITITILITFTILLACTKQTKGTNEFFEEEKSTTVVTPEKQVEAVLDSTEIAETDTLEIDTLEKPIMDSLEEVLYVEFDYADYNISDYVLHTSYYYSDSDPNEKYLKVPYILEHDDIYYPAEYYPDVLNVAQVITELDTLDVIIAKSDCSDCLDIFKIQNQNGFGLYSNISFAGEKIVELGDLDFLLQERDLSEDELFDEKYIKRSIEDWKSLTRFEENLNHSFLFASDLRLKKQFRIEDLRKKLFEVDKSEEYTLEGLVKVYEDGIDTDNVISFYNGFEEYTENKYLHNCGFSKSEDLELDVLLKTNIDIIYISEKNELFRVNWLQESIECIDDSGAPSDDNYVEQENGRYLINNWKNGAKIDLFHPDMVDGSYLVMYEVKPKHLDTYIYSDITTIGYQKPK